MAKKTTTRRTRTTAGAAARAAGTTGRAPTTAGMREARGRLTRTMSGLGLLRSEEAEAGASGRGLTAGEFELAQAALRYLELRRRRAGGKEPARAKRQREDLQHLVAAYLALGQLRTGLTALARRSACGTLRLETALTERNDRVLSFVETHTAERTGPDPHQLDVRFAGASMIYESVLQRAKGRRTRTVRSARALSREVTRAQSETDRLVARERLREAPLRAGRTTRDQGGE